MNGDLRGGGAWPSGLTLPLPAGTRVVATRTTTVTQGGAGTFGGGGGRVDPLAQFAQLRSLALNMGVEQTRLNSATSESATLLARSEEARRALEQQLQEAKSQARARPRVRRAPRARVRACAVAFARAARAGAPRCAPARRR
jgi:hypothetical protein